jgi:acyl carrier protein
MNEAAEQTAEADRVVSRIVAAIAPDQLDSVTPDQQLINDLGYNSLLLMELAFTLEELFALDPISMGDPPPTDTVRDLQTYVNEKLANGDATLPVGQDVDDFLAAR